MQYAVPRDLERASDSRRPDPASLDRRADLELSAGRHSIAEKLSHQAAEMRRIGGDRDDQRVPLA